MVDDINSAKYEAKRKAEGKNLFARIAFILFYILIFYVAHFDLPHLYMEVAHFDLPP